MLLRFDAARTANGGFLTPALANKASEFRAAPNAGGGCLVFLVTLFAYVLSLCVTLLIMLYFEHAQPALLYIVPFVLIASTLTAVFVGAGSALISFCDPFGCGMSIDALVGSDVAAPAEGAAAAASSAAAVVTPAPVTAGEPLAEKRKSRKDD